MRTVRRMKRRSSKDKRKVILIAVAAAVLFAAGMGMYREKKEADRMRITQKEEEEPEESEQVEDTSGILWKGKRYLYKEDVNNYLFLGIDKEEMTDVRVGSAAAGQSDAIFLLSFDRKGHTVTKITIPRDTMTNIEAFDAEGESLGLTRDHISLAYGYGDGKHKSCELSKKAVSNLLYGIPIYGYCAIGLDSLPQIAESVGGLDVTIPNDSLEEVDGSYQKGSTIHLDEENTEFFVRYRNENVSQSAMARQERQEAFLQAFRKKAGSVYRKRPGFITRLYSDLKPHMVTDMSAGQFKELMGSDSKESEWTVPGEGVAGEYYDEYLVDDEALYEKIIETFYEEKQK